MGSDLPAARRHRRLKAPSRADGMPLEVGTNSSDRDLQRLNLLRAASLSCSFPVQTLEGRRRPPPRGGAPAVSLLPLGVSPPVPPVPPARACIRVLPKVGRPVFLWRGLERGLLGRALDLWFTWARIPRSSQSEQRLRHALILHSGCRYPFGEAAEERSRGGRGWS